MAHSKGKYSAKVGKIESLPPDAPVFSEGLIITTRRKSRPSMPSFRKGTAQKPQADSNRRSKKSAGSSEKDTAGKTRDKGDIRLKPGDAQFHRIVGYLSGALGRYAEAVTAFNEAIRINPNDAEAHYALGRAYSDQGCHTEAVEAYREAIRLKSDYTDAHYRLGLACGELGRHTEAIAACKRTLRIRPDHCDGHRLLEIYQEVLGNEAGIGDETHE